MHQKPKDFLVYLHRRKTDGKVFYVGKGDTKRANRTTTRSDYWNRVVAKYGFYVEIYSDGLQEWYAFELEKELISYYGRENLCNMTDGGEGTSGRIVSEISKKRCSISNKGIRPSDITIKAASDKNSKKITTGCGLFFDSISDASRFIFNLGLSKSFKAAKANISGNLNGRTKTAYEYVFYYLKDGLKYKKEYKEWTVLSKIKNNTGITFETISEAALFVSKETGRKVIASNIAQSCQSSTKKAYGYKWEFV